MASMYKTSFCIIFLLSISNVLAQVSTTSDADLILSENPDPFIAIDAIEILSRYGENGSSIKLQLGGIPLKLTQNLLISDVKNINGATRINGDPSGFGFTIGLSGDYLFEFDKFLLTAAAEEALRKVMTLYQDYEGKSIKIEGHTDSKGSNEYNQSLSEKRAASVYNWFLKNGLQKEVISFTGFGETKPVSENIKNGKDHPYGRALNRRVDILVTTNKKVNSLPTVSNIANLK